ncbi:DEAD/DEAH box helicase, partial [Streptomyces sp. NPDC055056]
PGFPDLSGLPGTDGRRDASGRHDSEGDGDGTSFGSPGVDGHEPAFGEPAFDGTGLDTPGSGDGGAHTFSADSAFSAGSSYAGASGHPPAPSRREASPYGYGPTGSPGPADRGFPNGRSRPRAGSPAVVLAAADPANAYGAALPWPESPTEAGHKPGRKAGSLVVLVDGELTLYMERGGKTLLAWPADPQSPVGEDVRLHAAAEALAACARAGSLGTVTVERVNGASALTSPLGTLLEAAGFIATPRGLRLRA